MAKPTMAPDKKVTGEGPIGLELRVNGRKAVRAVLPAEGVLVFHVALERGIAAEPAQKTVSIEGGDVYGTDTTGSRFMRWAKLHISVGDKVEVRFVTGGKSSPRPRVLSVDSVATRAGLNERLRVLQRQVGEMRRTLALSEGQRSRPGMSDWKRMVAETRRSLAAARTPRGSSQKSRRGQRRRGSS